MKRLTLLLIFGLISCAPSALENKNYEYPSEATISWSECFNQSFDEYYIYFYSPDCGNCMKIKQSFLSFYYKKTDVIYFVNTIEYAVFSSNVLNLIGVNDISQLYIPGTPTYLQIKNKVVSECFAGSKQIEEYICKK